jgi:hypothetical protein
MHITYLKARKAVYLMMQHITVIPRYQMDFFSLEDTILPENPVHFIDGLHCIFCPNLLLRQFALWARVQKYGIMAF